MWRALLKVALIIPATLLLPVIARGQNVGATTPYAELATLPVPVTAGDVVDRPYLVLADVETDVRADTALGKLPTDGKAFRELWERGRKLGADAVILATVSQSRASLFSFKSRRASGKAVKFLKPHPAP